MEIKNAVTSLSSLAQDTRLAVFRLLVQAGPEGLPAGEIAAGLGVPAATMSFHLAHLARAGLVTQRRRGRLIIYGADYRTMGQLIEFLGQDCCRGHADVRLPLEAATAQNKTIRSHSP